MAIKPDYPSLLSPGVHQLTLPELHELAVKPFSGDIKRASLFHKLSLWEGEVKLSGIQGVMWIDGSFLTQKPGPEDIDCVMWQPCWSAPANDTVANRNSLARLFDHASAKTLYGLDFYLETPPLDQLVHREAYWKGFFGYCHDRVTAKGFAEVHV